MRKICIYNHKGGVGKTTTAVNLAAGLSRQDKKILLVDLDPQGNVDLSLKIKADFDLYDALTGKIAIQRCILSLGKNLDVITSRETLAKAEQHLAGNGQTKNLLKDLLSKVTGYDFLLIDCPPSLGILNQNVLSFCDEVFIPTSADFLGYDALEKMQEIVARINEAYGSNVKITKVIPTLYDKRTRICRDTLEMMQENFKNLVGTPIRYNSKLKEAPRKGKSIFKYARSSPGAKDYGDLVEEVMAMNGVVAEVEIVS